MAESRAGGVTVPVPQVDETPLVTPRNPYAQDDAAQQNQEQTGQQQVSRPFGYDLFAGVPSTFAPATDIPVTADYLIGPGDTVNVQLFGNKNASYHLLVSRDGTIAFPEIGAITVAGMTYDHMVELLNNRINRQFIGVNATVTMGQLRSIRVFVLGDVQRPGAYTVSALSTMTNALFVSGGINLIGSLRDVQLKRAGRIVTRLDLYDLLLAGDTSGDKRLQPGDVIFVPPLGKTASITGAVRRPGRYELVSEKTVDELVTLAGDLLPGSHPDTVRLERITPHGERTVLDIALNTPAGRNTRIHDGDVIYIQSVLDRVTEVVFLSGYVLRPLSYQWHDGLRLSEIIPSEQTLKPGADVEYLLIKRAATPGNPMSLYSANLRDAWSRPGGAADIRLMPEDEIIIFSMDGDRREILDPLLDELRQHAVNGKQAPVVSVGGQARFPGDYPLDPKMHVSDLLRAAGHLKESAYTLRAELTRRSIEAGELRTTEHLDIDLGAILGGDAREDIILQPYDVLTIREKPHWREQQYVEIRGEVRFPGTYPIRPGETMRGLLDRAGGFNNDAFLTGAVFVREQLREREQKQLEMMADNLERELASLTLERIEMNPEQQQAQQFVKQLVSRLRESKAVGRLVISLQDIIEGKKEDITLRDGDQLYIPPEMDEVSVVGEVFFPTSHRYQHTLSRDDYLQQSGGITANADDKRIYVVRADGHVSATSAGRWHLGGKQKIYPGDTIVVPLDADRVRPIKLWTDVTQILYQLSLTAASMKTVGVF